MDFYLNKPASIFDLFQTTFQILFRGWKTILFVYFLVKFLIFISVLIALPIAQNQLHVCYCFWSSILEVAISEIVATIYIGGDPCYKRSLKKGWCKKWSILQFYFVVMPGVFSVIDKIQEKFALYNLVVVVLKVVLTITAPDAIAIENMSPTQALQRSMELCRKNIILFVATILYCGVLFSPEEMSENHGDIYFLNGLKSVFLWRVLVCVLYITMRTGAKDFDRTQFEKEIIGTSN